MVPEYTQLFQFAEYRTDFLNVLSYPLLEAKRHDVKDVIFVWQDWRPNEKAISYSIFFKILTIVVRTEDEPLIAVIPLNDHHTGRNLHLCLPIPWRFFNVKEATYLNDGSLKVHFDDSISVRVPTGSGLSLLHKAIDDHWTNRVNRFLHAYWKNEYIESWSIHDLEETIKTQLIHQSDFAGS